MPSNQTQIDISHKTTPPEISPPILDKISLCLGISDPEEQAGVEQNLWDEMKDPLGDIKSTSGTKGGYKTQARLHFPSPAGGLSAQHALIQVRPYVPKRPFFRLEFNPAKAGPDGIEHLKERFHLLLNYGYAQVILKGVVTRLDIAVDVIGVHVEDLVPSCKGLRRTRNFIGQDGKFETIYFGSPKGTQVAVYDRAKKLAKDGETPSHPQMTRVELRLKKSVALSNLAELQNPLGKIELLDLSVATPPEAPHHFAFFRDSVRLRGLKPALKLLPPSVRAKYEQAIAKVHVEWWNPETIWSAWPQVVADLGLLEAVWPDTDLAAIAQALDNKVPMYLPGAGGTAGDLEVQGAL